MPDGMELLARSLRAGYALPAAIELLGEEMPEPMGTEMMIVLRGTAVRHQHVGSLAPSPGAGGEHGSALFRRRGINPTGDRGQPGRTDGKYRRGDSGVA